MWCTPDMNVKRTETLLHVFVDQMVYSRVAQVCKNDRGGRESFRRHRWTSYFKARLNCSSPGSRPFYFNELRHMTEKITINGVELVFAVMTTPENSILGSAVCAYTVNSIEDAMTGSFMKRTSQDTTSVCWSKQGQRPSHTDPHPSSCPPDDLDTRALSNEILEFRKNHPLMRSAVQPLTNQPLFTRTRAGYVFTAIDVDANVTVDTKGRVVSMLYIGTSDGHLLKVVPYPFDLSTSPNPKREEGAFIDEINVFDPSKCVPLSGKSVILESVTSGSGNTEDTDDVRRVLNVKSVPGRDVILVAFRHCVIAVPKHSCSVITCRRKCIQSGNPYCGWLGNSCVARTEENKDEIEQDIYAERKDLPECDEGNSTVEAPTPCSTATPIAIPVALSVFGFLIIIVVFIIVMKYSSCRDTRRKGSQDIFKRNSHVTENPNWRADEPVFNAPIYKGPQRSDSKSKGHRGGGQQQSTSSYVAYDLELNETLSPNDGISTEIGGSEEFGDSSFSSAFSPGGASAEEEGGEYRRKFHGVNIVEGVGDQRDGKTDHTNLNNNNMKKNVGVAYPYNQAETPVRRRSVTSSEKEDQSSTPTRIQLGSRPSTPLGEFQFTRMRSLPNRIVTNPNFIPGISSRNPVVSRCKSQNNGNPQNNRKNGGLLPKPPVTGLTEVSPPHTRMVSTYENVSNSRNRTFGNGLSLPTRHQNNANSEPEYENVTGQRNDFDSDNEVFPDPPTPPPVSSKPLSSFTTSHFNTSWFPPPSVKDSWAVTNNDDYLVPNVHPASSSSGVMSASSSSSQDQMTVVSGEDSLAGKDSSRIPPHLYDEGYGSGSVCFSEETRMTSSLSRDPSSPYFGCQKKGSEIQRRISENKQRYVPGRKQPSSDEEILSVNVEQRSQSNPAENTEAGTLFNQIKKLKKSKKNDSQVVPDRIFQSDSPIRFDHIENPNYQFVPAVRNSGRREGVKSHDDSIMGNKPTSATNGQYAFYTMRPPGRMRQKLPRLRCTEKISDATLIPVLPPEIPKI